MDLLIEVATTVGQEVYILRARIWPNFWVKTH